MKPGSVLRLLATATLLALAGCAPTRYTWVRPDSGYAQTQQDLARCEYEAASSTATYGSSTPPAWTLGGAIGQGIGIGLGRAMEANRLVALCMRARGYAALLDGGPPPGYSQPPPQAQAAPTAGAASAVPPGAISGEPPRTEAAVAQLSAQPYAPPGAFRAAGESRYQIAAEELAKATGCAPPYAVMVGKGGGLEQFKIGCPDHRVLSVSCEAAAYGQSPCQTVR